jgi:hypothetical protein
VDGQFKKVMISNKLYEKNHTEPRECESECWTCGKPGEHQEWRDALNQYEITCDECHRNEYPEQYESSDDDEPQRTMDQDLEDDPDYTPVQI